MSRITGKRETYKKGKCVRAKEKDAQSPPKENGNGEFHPSRRATVPASLDTAGSAVRTQRRKMQAWAAWRRLYNLLKFVSCEVRFSGTTEKFSEEQARPQTSVKAAAAYSVGKCTGATSRIKKRVPRRARRT